MKKKILLIILMFLFITNVKALSFNVNVTNIEDKGSGSLGTIKKIDLENREVDAFFDEIGAEINFEVTVTNSGDRAGTLREITVTGTSENFEYTTNLPEGGMAIDGNGANKVTVTGKVKEGATNGKTSSEIKIKYNYDEGSCPEGEILSDDESMCLCPEGKVRSDKGTCEEPTKPIECKKDEVYNTEKKICEKKVAPVVPNNPKTLDNIILITLLFFVSGLGIYAVMFKRLKTNKKRVTVGVITGVATLGLSFTVLASVFGLDNLLSAIINPITKSKELIIKVNEEIDLIETWDGVCELDVSELTLENIFEGGSGTEEDPYQIKTAEQLGCFAKSVNNGNTYQGKYIKQTKDIKLNDNLNDMITAQSTNGLHTWDSIGYRYYDNSTEQTYIMSFNGTYNGDNHTISGLYLLYPSVSGIYSNYRGLFGYSTNATFKNIKLVDVYMNAGGCAGALLGYGYKNLTIDNVSVYGKGIFTNYGGAGIISYYNGNTEGTITIENSINNIDLTCSSSCSGIIHKIEGVLASDNPTIVLKNNINNGNLTFNADPYELSTLYGYITDSSDAYVLIENSHNTGSITGTTRGSGLGGIVGYASVKKIEIKNSDNTGDFTKMDHVGHSSGIIAKASATELIIENCFNSGDFVPEELTGMGSSDNVGGIVGYAGGSKIRIKNCYNTGNLEGSYAYLGGILGFAQSSDVPDYKIENCYNTGRIAGYGYVGGLVGNFTGSIDKSYNTGLVHSLIGPRTGGLVGWGGSSIYNSYNTGDIIVDGAGSQHGGLCSTDCKEIKNSYNRGNITVHKSGVDIGGIVGTSQYPVTNVYNSGTITYLNEDSSYAYVGGIISSNSYESVNNAYNLGDIAISQNGSNAIGITVGGISAYANVNGSVNKGNITININEAYTSQKQLYLGGISGQWKVSNSFNAGNIEFTGQSITGDGHQIFKGEIRGLFSVGDPYPNPGNKFNTNQNGKAIGCIGIYDTCTDTVSEQFGTYTTESTPDILSIINGDDAFEIKEGETLPTLKVFNQ